MKTTQLRRLTRRGYEGLGYEEKDLEVVSESRRFGDSAPQIGKI